MVTKAERSTMKKNVQIKYIRDDKGFPIATLAVRDDTSTASAVGISVWNRNDPFDKSLGRRVAIGRANMLKVGEFKEKAFWIHTSPSAETEDRFRLAMECCVVLNGPERLPTRVVRAIKRDLAWSRIMQDTSSVVHASMDIDDSRASKGI